MTYNQFVPYTDRLYWHGNNVAYAMAVEKLASWKCQSAVKRFVFCLELARISSHLLGVGVYGMDAGAWTVLC